MRKLLNNPWIVAALAAFALAFVGWSLLPGRDASGRSVAAAGNPIPADSPADEAAVSESHAADSAGLNDLLGSTIPRDPFAARIRVATGATAVERTETDTLRLSAIWTQGTDTFVVINGSIHQAGDEFAKFKIESANQDGIWISHGTSRDFLALGVDFMLKTTVAGSAVAASL